MRSAVVLRRAWKRSSRTASSSHVTSVSLHLTPCIVTAPPIGHTPHQQQTPCDALLNPANAALAGTRFSPAECEKNLPSEGIIYPPQVVDGLVSELGGAEMADEIRRVRHERQLASQPLGVGSALLTHATGELRGNFSHVIHAIPPDYQRASAAAPPWEAQLKAAFLAAFDEAGRARLECIAAPLMGAGARGAPSLAAARVAALAVASWEAAGDPLADLEVRFGVQDDAIADELEQTLHDVLVVQSETFLSIV